MSKIVLDKREHKNKGDDIIVLIFDTKSNLKVDSFDCLILNKDITLLCSF